MALRKLNTRSLLQLHRAAQFAKSNYSTGGFAKLTGAQKALVAAGGLLATSAVGLGYALDQSASAADLVLHPPHNHWPHSGWIKSLDIGSVRRGYEVYKQVCSACHSLKHVAYRELVDTIMTEEEARAEAAEIQVEDGPNEEGKMFMRPGKLSDHFPSPYPNEEAARHANNGAFPPDLSYITMARHGGEDYIFALLTGYCDAPAGVTVQEGQHFNPYFPGGAISMAKSLFNEAIEYADGTPATGSQMAKDVSSFLTWTAQPEHDERKLLLIKSALIGSFLFVSALFWKRHVWGSLKARKIIFRERK